MVPNTYKNTLIFAVLLLFVASCTRKKIILQVLPANTPKGAQIYVTGNFNNWNPADPNYLLKYNEKNNTYNVAFPIGFGKIEYKFTRGDWTTVETDSCGGELSNRSLLINDSANTIYNSIASWRDLEPIYCSRMVLEIDSLPSNTPKNTALFLIGNINHWSLANETYKFKKAENNKYYLTLFKLTDKVEFKINRGFNETVEANEFGTEINTRQIYFGKKDTASINIKAWLDLPLRNQIKHTFIIKNIPANTQSNANIFLVGDFNNWNPYDRNFIFNKLSNGQYILTMNFNDKNIHEFKITRGGWDFQEADYKFNILDNRKVDLSKADTTYINISNWYDKAPNYRKMIERRAAFLEINLPDIFEIPNLNKTFTKPEEKEVPRKVVFILNKIPEYTNINDGIYLAGDFNGWNDKDDRFLFKRLPNGKYMYVLRLKDMDAHEYKITRGNWNCEAADTKLEKFDNRQLKCCQSNDTIYLNILNWLDYKPSKRVVFIIDRLPLETKSDIYLTGNFNNWNVKDEKFKFKVFGYNKRILTLNEFDKNYNEFKITRGNWETESSDKKNPQYDNFIFRDYMRNDTIHFTIKQWKDD